MNTPHSKSWLGCTESFGLFGSGDLHLPFIKDDGGVIFHLIDLGCHPIFWVKASFWALFRALGVVPAVFAGEKDPFGGINDRNSADYEGRGLQRLCA